MTKYRVKGYDMVSLLSAKRLNRREGLTGDDDTDNALKLGGVTIAILLTINLIIWLWALFALLKRQKTSNPLVGVALVFAILGLVGFIIPGGPILTLVLVYAV